MMKNKAGREGAIGLVQYVVRESLCANDTSRTLNSLSASVRVEGATPNTGFQAD